VRTRIDAPPHTTKVRGVPEKDTTKAEGDAGSEPRDDAEAARRDEPEKVEDREASTKGSSEDPEESAKAEEGGDEAAARVAEALGIESAEGTGDAADPEQAAAEAKEPAAAPNRAARRRDEAVKRRKKKSAGAGAADEKDDLPKDRNARAKELLLRRQEQAAERRPINLLPGEMVDDALARSWSATGKWLRTNFNVIQWVILLGLVGLGGFLFYTSRVEKKAGTASEALASAVAAQRGRVVAEDKRTDEEKDADPTRVFPTAEARADAALASYNQVIDQHPGTGGAILAKLGQAGILLEKRDYAHALDAYNAVLATPLAAADPDVKGRGLEGVGFAKEGTGDLDGAMTAFKEVEKVDAKGFKELGRYHQARIHVAKGEKEKAKDILVEILALKTPEKDPTKEALNPVDKGTLPGIDSQMFPYLKTVAQELLRSIDPKALPARTELGGPGGAKISPEELERLIKRAREQAEQKGGEPHGE
jgi:tetratricopeptide (TPR) repeat protein